MEKKYILIVAVISAIFVLYGMITEIWIVTFLSIAGAIVFFKVTGLAAPDGPDTVTKRINGPAEVQPGKRNS